MHCEGSVHPCLSLISIEKQSALKFHLPILETDLGG